MANNEPFDITDEGDLKGAVRDETQYGTDLIDEPTLDGLVDSGKRELALRTDVTAFFDDRGIAVALLGIVCAKAKGAVENSPVVTKSIGAEDVTFRTSDGSSLQLTQYEQMTQHGLSNSDETTDAVQNIEVTRDFFRG